ncbi:hypothetical protein [Arthrobacter sp. zg-Y1171]|uniref:hypothetical protein n=1 Tax=Arthrobacter sp. zg-Y1171 TaxID=2964610 RepID=UPI00210505AA|nr:hypothetical protein [Arthrobacter sp. zg-Y1171]MCQ1996480.1 hypothetical protein [Arthrobacter sp. zg-Y1171]UWX82082.1 hypothetical protein N2L00_01170 [Arthrobacter sp. zg-Y1171]
MLILILGACAMNTPTDSARSVDPVNELETIMRGLLDEGKGVLTIESLREESCLAPERVDHPEVETGWIGQAAGTLPSSEEADASLERIATYLRNEGWELKQDATDNSPNARATRLVSFQKDPMFITVEYLNETSGARLDFLLTTDCRENPEGHQVVRSELDPDYGTPSSIYSDSE